MAREKGKNTNNTDNNIVVGIKKKEELTRAATQTTQGRLYVDVFFIICNYSFSGSS